MRMTDFEVRRHFGKVLEKLDVINAKVSGMPQVQVQLTSRYLLLIQALQSFGRPVSAGEVAMYVGMSRAYVSMRLNDLVDRGLVVKHQEERKKVFSLKRKEEVGK